MINRHLLLISSNLSAGGFFFMCAVHVSSIFFYLKEVVPTLSDKFGGHRNAD
jgi:hypothetical protein